MLILSFDCANKSLAYSLVEIDIDSLKKSLEKYPNKCKTPTGNSVQNKKLHEIYIDIEEECKYIKYIKGDVVDLLNGEKVKDVNSVDRAKALRKFIDNTDFSIDKSTKILIEKQPITCNQ